MDDEQELRSNDRRHERVLALSDGVFAIVITLLVLEMHVLDPARGETVAEAMSEIGPSFIAFLISFVVIAITWADHRDLFTLAERIGTSIGSTSCVSFPSPSSRSEPRSSLATDVIPRRSACTGSCYCSSRWPGSRCGCTQRTDQTSCSSQ
jgi:Endosomal/lysosomal potassium channel TMEM175